MERRSVSARDQTTVLTVIEPGEEPLVDCLQTAEGRVTGPYLWLLGSVSTKQALRESNGESIEIGRIIPGHRLVVGSTVDRHSRYVLPGIVNKEELYIKRAQRSDRKSHRNLCRITSEMAD